jgi:glutamate-1-semialdehyde 2,1-aminomutase
MSRSSELYARALTTTPGGVHSPVRSFKAVGGHPLFIEGAAGVTLHDADGRDYVDFCMAFGPLIFGHRDPDILNSIQTALNRGWSYGTAEATSLELAELVTQNIPWVEQIRFVNSGTEAVMSALRLARAATGRSKIIKFSGCYHGHADSMLIQAGSGLADTAVSDSSGITDGVAADTLVAHLDDIESVEHFFTQFPNDIAALIIEPLPANHGLLPQKPEFLKQLRTLCSRHDTLLIFDEVISGFRVAFGGYAEICGIQPDLVTYGKIIGGGFPVGAYAGRAELMQLVAPAGSVYQAGTLSANPVAMAAGLRSLQKLLASPPYAALEKLNHRLRDALAKHTDFSMQSVGSLLWLCHAQTPGSSPLRAPKQIPDVAASNYPNYFHHLLDNGIYLAPSSFEVAFLSTAHTEEHIDLLVAHTESYMLSSK